MLRPEYLAGAADSVVEVYSQVEQDIAEDIARRIVKNGGMTQTARWQAYKGREFGFFQEDVDMIMSKASPKAKREIPEIMAEAAEMSLSYDDSIYISAGLSPTAIRKSPAMMAMLLQGTDSTLALIGNFTKTTAIMSTIGFNNILDRAYMQILSGAFDPNTAIRRAVKEIASKGVDKIAYPSGASTSVEAAVRRAVTTGVNQSVAKLQLARAEEMGCNLVETSSHAGARPTHAEWQGQVFCIKGHHKHYGDFYKETGYGTGDGLCGWNCYHSFFPFFEGLSTPSFSRDPAKEFLGKDNDEMYREQQQQRYYERQIRAAKKECIVYNAAMESATNDTLKDELYQDFQKASVKLKQREAALQRFIDETGRTRLRERESTGKWNRSISSKAVWANKRRKR